jgi:hypothetical protein
VSSNWGNSTIPSNLACQTPSMALAAIRIKSFCPYLSYRASNSSPHTLCSPGHSCGHIKVQFSSFSTRLMNRSGIHIARNRSRARCSSAPVFLRQSRNWKTSACHGSRYMANAPGRCTQVKQRHATVYNIIIAQQCIMMPLGSLFQSQ